MSAKRAAALCNGSTGSGQPCQNTTTHPTGWCGQCGAPPAALAAYAPAASSGPVLVGPGPDPLGDPAAAPDGETSATPSPAAEEQAALITRLTGIDTMVPLSSKWAGTLAGCDECACLFVVDDTEFLDRFVLNPDKNGNCSANADCPCHELPPKLPDGIYEATDPATSPPRLADLADSDDLLVLRGVAANPSTPAEALTALAVPFPENPAMGDLTVQRAAAANPSLPPAAQAALAGKLRTASAVAENPAVCAEAAETIAGDPAMSQAHRALASNPGCPPAVLARIASDPAIHETARMAAAANPNSPKAARAAAGLLAG